MVLKALKKIFPIDRSKLLEYFLLTYKVYDMFSFLFSFKKDVKSFITSAEARLKALETKVEGYLTAPVKAVEAEVSKVEEAPPVAVEAGVQPNQPAAE